MEKIIYNKTLDTHKNGVQFTLQGFETADKMSRRIVISLMGSGDAIDLPLEQIEAVMYVTTPNVEKPSINACTIKDNTIIYDVLPITEEGITTMQLKLIETRPDGARSVLASPSFAVEVLKSNAEDESIKGTTSYTAVEQAISRANEVYNTRLMRIALHSDCMFYAYYADGTIYESDVLKELFLKGEALLSQSYARGGTGTRDGEDTDNSMYYSNVSRSASLTAQESEENSLGILEEVKLHGVYTAFSVDFETGELEYVSPSFKFEIDKETGELEAIGQTYTFNNEVGRVVEEWLATRGVELDDLQSISTDHEERISALDRLTSAHSTIISKNVTTNTKNTDDIVKLNEDIVKLYAGVENAKVYKIPWDLEKNVKSICQEGIVLEASTDGLSIFPRENEVSFSLINSGEIKVKCYSSYPSDYSKSTLRDYEITILQNDEIAYNKLEEIDLKGTYGAVSSPLTVKEGDIITVRLKVNSKSDEPAWMKQNINIHTNYATPYKYWNLNDFVITE